MKSPTHFSHVGTPSTIDLALCSNPTLVERCTTVPELQNSDHLSISISIHSSSNEKPATISRNIWLYQSADIARANELIRTIEWNEQFQSGSVDECVSEWCSVYLQVLMEVAIPQKLVKDKHSLPWISKDVIKAIRKRKYFISNTKCPTYPFTKHSINIKEITPSVCSVRARITTCNSLTLGTAKNIGKYS